MMPPNFSKISLELVFAILFGALVGAAFVVSMSNVSARWTLVILGSVIAVALLLFVTVFSNKLKLSLLIAALLSLPIFFDINFFYRDYTPFYVSANGFSVTLFDLFFFPLFFYWLWKHNQDKSSSFRFEPVFIWFFSLLFFFNLLSSLISPFPFYSFSALSWFFKAILIFTFFRNNYKDEATLQILGRIFALILLLQGIIVLEQKFVGAIFTEQVIGKQINIVSLIGNQEVKRVAGSLSHPNNLAMFLNLFLPVACLLFFEEKKVAWRMFFGISIFLALLAELWTSSRGGWLALAFSGSICFILIMHKQGFNLIKVLLSFIMVSILAATVLLTASETFRTRIFGEDYGTADLRVPLMQVAENMIVDNPVLGVGLNVYAARMQHYDNTNEYVSRYYPFPVHNTYLLMAAESGLPSLILFLALIVYILWLGLRSFYHLKGINEKMILGLMGGVVTWLIHNLVNLDDAYMNKAVWVLLGMIAGLAYSQKIKFKQREVDNINE
ncbi:O-antigen ligase family protein [Pseudoalteromonas tunicata]|jgi:O-antigen ligase|uniref:Membrane protein of EXOQ family, involved in exopolysaccharide production n=1 Tax=Pseudoalteromonas tunicata D2 TaxID=87626 RepID=A4C652_9GAMM|nr:O-antigen ligase family protein [Pseudoalteromonas tunicata]ATC95429.1 hypothetical protein PTUN_a3038 [Pseudoalteromonas tunicata]AXT31007.1 O-antigen ligase domain-containing protein [Pseudoalteromonas tunicata]EAR29456.1 Membrane protein of EXOQ family, involved in exopolysaccharide production [Pseudoalteromonas tunicata D2]